MRDAYGRWWQVTADDIESVLGDLRLHDPGALHRSDPAGLHDDHQQRDGDDLQRARLHGGGGTHDVRHLPRLQHHRPRQCPHRDDVLHVFIDPGERGERAVAVICNAFKSRFHEALCAALLGWTS